MRNSINVLNLINNSHELTFIRHWFSLVVLIGLGCFAPITKLENDQMKMIKSRRAYKCHECSGPIEKGSMYRKRSVSIGSPHKPDRAVRMSGAAHGIVAYEMQGIRYDVQICAQCTQQLVRAG